MWTAIQNRRSIRKYQDKEVPKPLLEEILLAGMSAPSSKNRQPWKFVVVSGAAKEDLLQAMRRGLEREKQDPLLPGSARYRSGAEHTLQIMREAPVVILILNVLSQDIHTPLTPEERIYEICNMQSIGAAIENMSLAAVELGLGSLWICDTFFACRELNEWLHTEGDLAAALAVGYAAEDPPARPRKPKEDTIEWRE